MTLDNLITLITAGFTKEEILTMSATATATVISTEL